MLPLLLAGALCAAAPVQTTEGAGAPGSAGESEPSGSGGEEVSPQQAYPDLLLRFPLSDLPFNAHQGGSFPSMQQSLHLVANLSQAVHHSTFRWVSSWLRPPWARVVSVLLVAAADVLLSVPAIWLHEEWHRAVMSQRGIASFNDVYNLRIVSGTIAVSHVADADLARLKRDHPAEQVRLSAAGMESELELLRHLQQQAVFQALPATPDVLLGLYSAAAVIGYRATCASADSDQTTDALNAAEGANIAVRDFTGLDCDAWVYDLHRPQEPYSARGVHPSGVGVDRYIRYSDLTAGEQRVMRQVRNLGLLNLVSPFLFGFGRFKAHSPLDGGVFYWNGALRHHLTSYGHQLSVDLFLARERTGLLLAYHHGMNQQGTFPALEAGLVRLPLRVGSQPLHASMAVMAWLQPQRQSFLTAQATAGGLARATLDVPVSRAVELYFELQAKSEGWVAGVVELEPALAFRGGLLLRL